MKHTNQKEKKTRKKRRRKHGLNGDFFKNDQKMQGNVDRMARVT